MKTTLFSVRRQLILLAFGVLLFSLVPVADVYKAVGTEWQGVPPVYTDEEYYYARIKEVKDGFPFLGNPYFYEHRNDLAPTFFVTDWLAALPLFAGLSLSSALVINFFLWSLAFVFCAFFLLREVRLGKNLAAIIAFLLYIQSYLWVLRPVAMQQVFPFFFLLLLAALRWYRQPESRGAKIFLAGAVAATFYAYLYLFEATVIAAVLLIGVLVVRKDWLRLRSLIVPSVLGIVLALPALVYTALQLKQPFYWQMAERITLVYTHLPTAEVVYSGSWVILAVLMFFCMRHYVSDANRQVLLVLSVFGVALVCVQALNVITGTEAETAVHVKRFIVPWLGITLGVFSAWLLGGGSASVRLLPRTILCIAIAAVAVVNIHFVTIPNFFTNATQDARARAIQTLAAPLAYLDGAEPNPVVVWAVRPRSDDAYYIPILTKHYVLYAHPGMWHLVDNDEIMERYLLANSVQGVTKEKLLADMDVYGGPAMAWHRANTINREVRLCQLLHLEKVGYACGETVTSEQLLGEGFFDALLTRNEDDIQPNLPELLAKYHVAYVLSPGPVSDALQKEVPMTQVYQDENYTVYRLVLP